MDHPDETTRLLCLAAAVVAQFFFYPGYPSAQLLGRGGCLHTAESFAGHLILDTVG
jgi:hypothetical protein